MKTSSYQLSNPYGLLIALIHTCIVACMLLITIASAHAAPAIIEGLSIVDRATVGGKSLPLNGSAVRTRIIFKTHVGALYLPEYASTLESVMAQAGPKRIQMNMLVELSSNELGKRFVDDYRAVTTPEEAPKLINDLFLVGGLFGAIPRVTKGDRLAIDWLPSKGYQILFNDKPLMSPIDNELFYKVLLRLFLGKTVPSTYRDGLLGVAPTQARAYTTIH
jgi:Chalcone isomerase-like